MTTQQQTPHRLPREEEQEHSAVSAAKAPQPVIVEPAAEGHLGRHLEADLTSSAPEQRLLFFARQQPDGTFAISLTDEGVQTFETALGIAEDMGGNTRLSPRSTLADLMERTATREELAALLRQGRGDLLPRLRALVLRRRLRGTESPSAAQTAISRLGKVLIVAVLALVALQQWAIAFADLTSIPGILAGLPGDLLSLHPTAAFQAVGRKIADAEQRALAGVLLLCVSYLAASLIRPLGTIYRQDQLVPGERPTLRLLHRILKRFDRP